MTTRWLLLAGLFGMAASCTLDRGGDPGTRLQALLDAYHIAHGMAASTVENPDVDPAVKMQLIRLDRRAYDAVAALTRGNDGFADEEATARAVSALTDYAARQTASSP